MIKKVMISLPMVSKSDEEIATTREKAIKYLEEQCYEVVNTFFKDEFDNQEQMESEGIINIPLYFLAKSLEKMSLCHVAYFCKGWENARGCRIEHEAAKACDLQIIYEK